MSLNYHNYRCRQSKEPWISTNARAVAMNGIQEVKHHLRRAQNAEAPIGIRRERTKRKRGKNNWQRQ